MSTPNHYALPRVSLRFVPVWRRNFLVWRKLAIPSILGNLADPMIYMLGLGYGLGSLLPVIGGVSYVAFLAAGTVCFSTTNSATFETLYSGFSRMHVQRTWDAIMNAPVDLDDVVLAELVWAASKSFLSGLAILVVRNHQLIFHTAPDWIVPIALLLAGLLFFWWRERDHLSYGLFEVMIGLLISSQSIVTLPSPYELSTAKSIQLVGGLYVMVRGFDTIDRSIEDTRLGGWWKRLFRRG